MGRRTWINQMSGECKKIDVHVSLILFIYLFGFFLGKKYAVCSYKLNPSTVYSHTVVSFFLLSLSMCIISMIPTYRYSLSSPRMPFFDLNNEDHNHHLFTSSSSSPSYSVLFNQNQDQTRSYSWESNHILSDGVEVTLSYRHIILLVLSSTPLKFYIYVCFNQFYHA